MDLRRRYLIFIIFLFIIFELQKQETTIKYFKFNKKSDKALKA